MRTMKDSGIEWIGDIPADWNIKRVKAVLCERNESNNPIQTDEILSLTNDRGVIPYEEKGDVGNKSKEDLTGYKLAYPGDIVLNSMNVFIGSVGLSSYFGCVSPVYYMLYPRNKNDSVSFFNYLFQTKELQTKLHGYGNGIMEIRMRIQMSKLNSVQLPVPPSDVQHKIAAHLDRKCSQIDAIIARQKEVIEKLKAYRLSIITEAVTKGLNPDVPMKDSGIPWVGNICNHYALSRVGAFCFVTKLAGFEYTDIMSSAISDTGEVPIVRAQNVRMFNFNDNIDEYIGLDVSQKLYRCALNKKCLLITFIGAGIGDVCVFSKTMRYHLAPNVAKIEIRDEYKTILDEEYLMFYLGSLAGKGEISKISKASAQPSLSMGTIRGITIAVPPIDEQREISEYLSKKIAFIDKVVRDKESIIENLLAYKSSLIYEVVTGKKEV